MAQQYVGTGYKYGSNSVLDNMVDIYNNTKYGKKEPNGYQPPIPSPSTDPNKIGGYNSYYLNKYYEQLKKQTIAGYKPLYDEIDTSINNLGITRDQDYRNAYGNYRRQQNYQNQLRGLNLGGISETSNLRLAGRHQTTVDGINNTYNTKKTSFEQQKARLKAEENAKLQDILAQYYLRKM
jgi:hypothetical protein